MSSYVSMWAGGHRIEAVTAEGVTATESPGGHPAAASRTVLEDGLSGVLGTGRYEPAGGWSVRSQLLIEGDRTHRYSRGA